MPALWLVMTTYRIYMDCVYADDIVSAVSGDAIFPMDLSTTTIVLSGCLGCCHPQCGESAPFWLLPGFGIRHLGHGRHFRSNRTGR